MLYNTYIQIYNSNTFGFLSSIGHMGYNGKLNISRIMRSAAQLDVICTFKWSYLPEQGGHIRNAY